MNPFRPMEIMDPWDLGRDEKCFGKSIRKAKSSNG